MASLANLPRRALVDRPTRTRVLAAAVIALLAVVAVCIAVFEGDLPADLGQGAHLIRPLLHRYGVGAAFFLLYLEESGVPMPLPGDVAVMYIGHRAAINPLFALGAWLGLIATIVLGATNLYYISRRWGRSLLDNRIGRLLDLSPTQIARAEGWFERWGFWSLVVGRHVPGLRMPLTVAAGIFRVRYSVFIASVALSTAIWSALFLAAGIAFGSRVSAFLQIHRQGYVILPLLGIVAFAIYLFAVRRRLASA